MLSTHVFHTIGWEIEIPNKFFEGQSLEEDQRLGRDYERFFTIIGLPINKANFVTEHPTVRSHFTNNLFIEVESPPSYSSAVQKRLLAELIKANAIPTLFSSTNAVDIQTHLDPEQLVSLHVSTVVPQAMRQSIEAEEKRDPDLAAVQPITRLEMLEDLLALGFTSPERLETRAVSNWYIAGTDIPSIDGKESMLRYQMRAHEVRAANVYRLFDDIQLLCTTAFSADVAPFNSVWEPIATYMKSLYATHGVNADSHMSRRDQVIPLARMPEVVSTARSLINTAASETQHILYGAAA